MIFPAEIISGYMLAERSAGLCQLDYELTGYKTGPLVKWISWSKTTR
jgi:hypothetical protein